MPLKRVLDYYIEVLYLRSLELMVLIYSHSDSEIGQKRLSATFRGVPPTFKFQWLL